MDPKGGELFLRG